MESSILISTKKILNLSADYTAFDLDVLTHINAAFAVVTQLGVGPETGFMIEDDTALWEELPVPIQQLNTVKTYIWLRVKMLFDPPTTSFLITAMEKQLAEYEWRLNVMREGELWTAPTS